METIRQVMSMAASLRQHLMPDPVNRTDQPEPNEVTHEPVPVPHELMDALVIHEPGCTLTVTDLDVEEHFYRATCFGMVTRVRAPVEVPVRVFCTGPDDMRGFNHVYTFGPGRNALSFLTECTDVVVGRLNQELEDARTRASLPQPTGKRNIRRW